MCWEAITAIATSLTVVVMVATLLLLRWFTKPRIVWLSSGESGWFYFYETRENKSSIAGARINIELELENDGDEESIIKGNFRTSDGKIFRSVQSIELKGHGATIKEHFILEIQSRDGLPSEGRGLHGTLELEPWGNKRLFWGKKHLTKEFDIPEKQGEIYRGLKNRIG